MLPTTSPGAFVIKLEYATFTMTKGTFSVLSINKNKNKKTKRIATLSGGQRRKSQVEHYVSLFITKQVIQSNNIFLSLLSCCNFVGSVQIGNGNIFSSLRKC
jgi:hypothetical protein